jgi:hypothetical protein
MLFKRGIEQPSDGALGKILAALQGRPDLLLAGYVGTTKLMEVQINRNLVRASDGMGFRAFAARTVESPSKPPFSTQVFWPHWSTVSWYGVNRPSHYIFLMN